MSRKTRLRAPLDALALASRNMGQFSLTVCVATGDFGKPATVGVATNERVMSDGTALADDVIAPATGVGVGVVIQVIEDDMEDVITFAI